MTGPRLVMTQAAIDRDRGRWLEHRTHGITGSEIAKVLGITPSRQGRAYSLYHAKISGVETEDNDAMMRGRYLEPYVDERYVDGHPGRALLPAGLYRHQSVDWMMATLDRLECDAELWRRALDDNWEETVEEAYAVARPVQIKTAGSYDGWGEQEYSAEIPVHYRAQCLWEMETWGAGEILIPVLFIIPWKIRVYRLAREMPGVERDIDYMLGQAEAFRGRLERRDPPPPDWTPASTETLRKLHPDLEDRDAEISHRLAMEYLAAQQVQAEAKQRMGAAQNQLREVMGNAARATIDGQVVAQRRIFDSEVKAFTRHTDGLWAGKWITSQLGDD